MTDFITTRSPKVARFGDHISTALEYFDAKPAAVNRATAEIDAGNEPYLVSYLGTHPYVAVHDVGSELIDGKVELFTASRSYLVDPETLLVWR